jgi:hypothetical protein
VIASFATGSYGAGLTIHNTSVQSIAIKNHSAPENPDQPGTCARVAFSRRQPAVGWKDVSNQLL